MCPYAEQVAGRRADESGVDPLRLLVEDTAGFAQAYLRWIDQQAADGLTLPRLRLVERLHCQGPAMMRTLADELELSPRNMTALVDSLERDGLVRRVPHPRDRRAIMVELTTSGNAAAEGVLDPQMAAMSCLFTDLTDDEQREFRVMLGKLRAGILRRKSGGHPLPSGP
ncbi:MAG TPA: MarR family transcriptional regulator [Acidimicrobiales bacterium]|nr:MarR family transcriptional regulator [Acidimicrobiales bacterium]